MQLSYIHEQKEKLRKEIEIKKQESGRFSFLRFLSLVFIRDIMEIIHIFI